jgi:hypothetical protein
MTMSNTTSGNVIVQIGRKYLPKVKCTLNHARSVASAGAPETIVKETKQLIEKL